MNISRATFVIFTLLLIILSVGVISLSENSVASSEKKSPSDWVTEDQINVYNDKIILAIANATWAKFTNTNSMDPMLDEDAHAIEILPANPEKINVGDIISYRTKYGVLIHRVIDRNWDEDGIYYIVKGDNNVYKDPFKVRYSDIKGVLVAVIY